MHRRRVDGSGRHAEMRKRSLGQLDGRRFRRFQPLCKVGLMQLWGRRSGLSPVDGGQAALEGLDCRD